MKTYVILKEFQHFIAYENVRVNHYIVYHQRICINFINLIK